MNEPSYNGIPFERYKEFFEAYQALAPTSSEGDHCNFVFNLDFIIRLLDSLAATRDYSDKIERLERSKIELIQENMRLRDELRRLRNGL